MRRAGADARRRELRLRLRQASEAIDHALVALDHNGPGEELECFTVEAQSHLMDVEDLINRIYWRVTDDNC